MYLGTWNEKGPKGHPVEEGFGITYFKYPNKDLGMVSIGSFKDGFLHGAAESFWLESSLTWEKNRFPGSAISAKATRKGCKGPGIPFRYIGNYKRSMELDQQAVVTLKDGTTRIGPWEDGEPVGDWYKHPKVAKRASIKHEPDEGGPPEVINIADSDESIVKQEAGAEYHHQSCTTSIISNNNSDSTKPADKEH